MPRPIFILRCSGAPDGAPAPVVDWTEICHGQKGKDFIFIDHDPFRELSRWTHTERKRPWIVRTRNWHQLGAASTLDGAYCIAARHAGA